jgi:hypothetical protein
MIKDCDPFSGQKIAHNLRFVGWDILVEERPGTFPSIFRLNSKDSEIIRIHCLTFWQKFLVNDSFGIEENG